MTKKTKTAETNNSMNSPKKGKKKGLKIAIIAVLFLLISNTVATKIIYDNIFKGYHEAVPYNTAEYTDLIESRVTADYQLGKYTLASYYYDNPDSGELIVIAPGLNSGADDYLADIAYFYDKGYDVFSFDPVGSDNSEGKSSRGYSQEIFDLDYSLTYVEENCSYDHLYLLGHSRGATAVCAMLSYDHDIDAVVSVSGFNSAMDAVIGLSSKYVGPVANINYPTLWAYQLTLFGYQPLQSHADKEIAGSRVPVLVLQGEDDDLASPEEHSTYSYLAGQSLPNCTSLLLEGCGHTDILYDAETGAPNEEVLDQIVDFLQVSGS